MRNLSLGQSARAFDENAKRLEHPSCTVASEHKFREPFAGGFRCELCGFFYERHGIPGFPENGAWPCYYVDRIHKMPRSM